MSPNAAAALALFVLEEAIKLEPAIFAAVQSLLNKDNPSPAEWDELRARVVGQSYAGYVPRSDLPPEP